MIIRTATASDLEEIREICLSAFDKHENEIVADLAVDLFKESSSPEVISLVAEIGHTVVGHVCFSPVRNNATQQLLGYILEPLAVKPEHQKSGIGSKLVERGLQQLKQQDIAVTFVYGDPNYYGRFGFMDNPAQKHIAPYPLQHPEGWLAIEHDSKQSNTMSGSITCVQALCKPELW